MHDPTRDLLMPCPPPPDQLVTRYRDLQHYVGLTAADMQLAVAAWPLIKPHVPELVDDFYEAILQQEEARRVIGDLQQVTRLKKTLVLWVAELFAGTYDEAFVQKRWQVGFRHVQIGLAHVWVSAAMTRLRERLVRNLRTVWTGDVDSYAATVSAIGRMMDLDLALIQDAYHAESVAQRISHERDFAEGVIETAQAAVMVVTLDGQIVRGNAFLSELIRVEPNEGESNLNSTGERLAVVTRPDSKKTDWLPVVNIFDLVAQSSRTELATFLSDAAAGRSVRPLETELKLAGGSPRRIRWLARFLRSREINAIDFNRSLQSDLGDNVSQGNIASSRSPLILCVGQDITDLTEAQRLLVRQERLAAIGQTMTGLAHESRNAFQRSQASLEMLLLELEDRPSAVELIERIQRAHDHLLHLYEEVLQFARPVHLELQPLRLAIHIQQTWQYIQQGGTSQGTRLAITASLEHDEVFADPFAIEQVLRNLLENAAQASDPDGAIDVALSNAWIGSEPAIQIVIRDHGRGLPEEYLGRLFEPFFTTRSRGTGLGLPIARRLIEAHGGSIKLAPASGRGTCAIVVLPRKAIPEPQLTPVVDDPRRSSQEASGNPV